MSSPPGQPQALVMPRQRDRLTKEDRTHIYLHQDLKDCGQSHKPLGLKNWAFWDRVIRLGLAAIAIEQAAENPPDSA